MPKPEKITHIVIHTSDSRWASVKEIREWHLARGFNDIGYHYVILNGYEAGFKGKKRDEYTDGAIRLGRNALLNGAHAPGYNKRSIAVCLVGKHGKYTEKQLAACKALTVSLIDRYTVPVSNVIGHFETKSGKRQGKTCPNINMDVFRKELNASLFMLHSYLELVF